MKDKKCFFCNGTVKPVVTGKQLVYPLYGFGANLFCSEMCRDAFVSRIGGKGE